MASATCYIYFIFYIIAGYIFSGTETILLKSNNNDRIINAQSNFNLTCLGKKPITWTFPNKTVEEDIFSEKKVLTAENPKDKYPYVANLSITNASYVDTGFYYCHEIEAEKTERKSSRVYIFVRDEEHLSTVASELQFMSVPKYSDAIIPCRPTSPDVRVTLIDFNDNMVFNQYIGFKIRINEHSIHCKCVFERNGKTEETLYIISVYSKTKQKYIPSEIEKPSIINVGNIGKTRLGQILVLNCTLKVDLNVYIEITWDVPDKDALNTGRITYTPAHRGQIKEELVGSSALTVKNVTLKDAGNYTCTVKDHANNTNAATIKINVEN